MSELLEDGLLTLEEVDEMFQALPKAGDGASIDLNGFAEFTTKVALLLLNTNKKEGGS